MAESRFIRRSLPQTGIQDTNVIRRQCQLLEDTINSMVPDGREKALALTNLEQACMWANKAIANQYPPGNDGD